jgi:hypothetical protein
MKKIIAMLFVSFMVYGYAWTQNVSNFVLEAGTGNNYAVQFFTSVGRIEQVNVPASIDGRVITEISAQAFVSRRAESRYQGDTTTMTSYTVNGHSINRNIFSVLLPPTVTRIGAKAFSGNYLTTIIIGNDVEIGSDSFPFHFAEFYNANGKKAGFYSAEPANTVNGVRLYYSVDDNDRWDDWDAKWEFSPLNYNNDFYYYNDGSSISILYYFQYDSSSVTIPAEIEGLPVTEIAGFWGIATDSFTGVNKLRSITIGANVSFSEDTFSIPGFYRDYLKNGKTAGTYAYIYDDLRNIWRREDSPFALDFKAYLGLGYSKSQVNTVAFGGNLQLGIVTTSLIPFSVLGEFGIGAGWARKLEFPVGFEWHGGGVFELHFGQSGFGLSGGGGYNGPLFNKTLKDEFRGGTDKLTGHWYLRGGLVYSPFFPFKMSLYFDWYDDDWGVGVMLYAGPLL